ncbi:hypothetical protein CDL12_25024 [Handroanthus impetiginosus]|uniref:Nodulin-related protein 1 n=1 Tax=Handroanthus impetiginosus TaxID=429701 RepID=A0A2G9GAZ3_9LAMI|nr:hypothetical protein CDL12_25024 [Handroanthus impetiginosus]
MQPHLFGQYHIISSPAIIPARQSLFPSQPFPMDFLSNLAKGDQPKPTSDNPDNPDHQDAKKHSTSDLFGSAKVVAGAAQAQFRNEPEKYDKAKVAGAGADLLNAASEYGKLDESKGIGKYVDQAEDYLRKYNTSQPAATAPAGDSSHEKRPAADAEKPSGGGAGDYVKMAEGFLKKPSGDGGEKSEPPSDSSEGGFGDVMKMAGGFLKK